MCRQREKNAVTQETQNSQDKPSPSFWDRLLKGDEENPPLAQHPGVVMGTLIFLFPVGAYFLWRYTRWDHRLKWALTIGVPVLIFIGTLLEPDTPSTSNSGPSSSSGGSESSFGALNDVALLTTEKIVRENSWSGITPNRFHQMMEQTARDNGKTDILPIKFSTDGPTHNAHTGTTTLVQSFGKSIWCGYEVKGSTIQLVRVEINGAVFRPPNWRGR
jgi:hypothetical protein